MKKEALLPSGWTTPAAYSHAFSVEGASKTVYVAGQVGIRADGSAETGIEAQTRRIYENIQAILAQANLTLSDIVKATVYLVDPSDAAAFARVRAECLQGHKPASTLVYVKALGRPEWLVEVDVTAVGV